MVDLVQVSQLLWLKQAKAAALIASRRNVIFMLVYIVSTYVY